MLITILVLAMTLAVAQALETEGEIFVMLVFSQTTGPTMLNKIQGDIGISEPIEQFWKRGVSASRKLEADTYLVYAKNVEVCSFNDCTPCPDKNLEVVLQALEKEHVNFRWKARWDRVEKKWTCQ